MELNSFLFPAPQSSYTINGAIGDLLYIPRLNELMGDQSKEPIDKLNFKKLVEKNNKSSSGDEI